MTKLEKKAILVIVLMTLVWGGTFPLVKVLLNFLSPVNLLMYRFLFAALIAFPFLLRDIKKNRKYILKLIILSILLYIAYYAQTVGLKYTTSSKSAFITGLYVIFTPIFALFFTKEKLTLKLSISLLLSLMGLALLSNITFMHFEINIGDLITIISAVTFAIQIVLTNIYAKEIDILFITSFQMVFMFAMGIPFAGNFLKVAMPLWVLLSLIFLGCFAGFLAVLAETYSLKYLDPDRAAILFTLEPVFAGIFSFIFLNERLSRNGIIGAFLILIAMWLAATSKVKKGLSSKE